jgi:hypothetical protein
MWATSIAESKTFDWFILLLICITSVTLAFETPEPLENPECKNNRLIKIIEHSSTIIFFFELIFKVISTGFIFNGDESYLRSGWHVIDFCIVLTSLMTYFPNADDLSMFKAIRLIRLLRPLRLIGRSQNLKVSIQALILSIPPISSLLIIVLLSQFIFGIIAVNLFKSLAFECNTSELKLTPFET